MMIKITIEGMSCEHCAERIKQALLKITGVQTVQVDLKEKLALISLQEEIDPNLLATKITDLGYTVKKMVKN